MGLRELQAQHREWCLRNFGQLNADHALMGLAEELGELAHAHLKELQGIRGTAAEHQDAARDALGDLLVYAMSYANARGWDLEATLEQVWTEVRRRDWVADPLRGGT